MRKQERTNKRAGMVSRQSRAAALWVVALLALLASAPLAASDSLTMSYTIASWQAQGLGVHAKVQLTIRNGGSEELANVNVRAAGRAMIAKRVAQFSNIPAGESKTLEVDMFLQPEQLAPGAAMPLRVDSSDSEGQSTQQLVVARGQEVE